MLFKSARLMQWCRFFIPLRIFEWLLFFRGNEKRAYFLLFVASFSIIEVIQNESRCVFLLSSQ
jgi:hypothetical protein